MAVLLNTEMIPNATLVKTESLEAIPDSAGIAGYRSAIISRKVDPGSVPFDIERAYHFLKLRKSSPAHAEFDSAIATALPICREQIRPSFQYLIFGSTCPSDSTATVDLGGGIRFESQGLARRLATAHAAAFFVMTLGDGVDELIEQWTVTDFPMAYVADGVASTLLHGVLELLETELHQIAASSGLTLGRRFSPGFHRWDLNQQRQLFDLLEPEAIGVELTPEYVMLPRHSLSGVFSIVAKPDSVARPLITRPPTHQP